LNQQQQEERFTTKLNHPTKEEEMHIKAGFDTVESIVQMNLANMAKAPRVWTFTLIITVDRQIPVAAGMIASLQ